MKFVLHPWQLLLLALAAWLNRQQQKTIEYLITENQILKEKLGKKRILLNDDQRRRLAVKGKLLGRRLLLQIANIASPDTILRWHSRLIAEKWGYSDRRKKPGRPRIGKELVDLVVRMARENPTWGYDRIEGALENLGFRISSSSVGNILKAHGIEPASDRKHQTSWRDFLKIHWDCLTSIDFTTIEVWTKEGLVTYYLLFVMELSTRRVQLAGCTVNPTAVWMAQIGRNLTDPFDGFLRNSCYLLMDRDTTHCQEFRDLLEQAGVKPLRLPPRSPNLTPHIERFMRTIKEECLGRMIIFGEGRLRSSIKEFCLHYHHERNHQGLGNELIEPEEEIGLHEGEIRCRERLGGLLRFYYREAA